MRVFLRKELIEFNYIWPPIKNRLFMELGMEEKMNFDYTETQQLIAESARDFAKQFIEPYVMEWDEKQIFPVDVLKKDGAIGFYGLLVPEHYGGYYTGYH